MQVRAWAEPDSDCWRIRTAGEWSQPTLRGREQLPAGLLELESTWQAPEAVKVDNARSEHLTHLRVRQVGNGGLFYNVHLRPCTHWLINVDASL